MSRGFRVWDEAKKQYDEIHTYFLSQEGTLWRWSTLPDDERLQGLPDNLFIVEFDTGLRDKNGKMIREGDIIEQFVCGVRKFKGKECRRRTVWQVRWNKEECCFELHYLSGSLFGDSMLSNDDEYEVIGNIHENPELLEDEK